MLRPLIYSDFPDPDVICVDGIYYMVSTTMHMFPGGDLYRSKDLLTWEPVCHIYDRLDETPAQRLTGGNIYGQGMWAACIRHHNGVFHVFFVCNDTRKTYHYTASKPEGPWQRHEMQGFYHDCSVLFDDDRTFIVSGNREIRLQELKSDLSGPKDGGIDTVILRDLPEAVMMLGYEGSHFYKINGRYYLFLIHWPTDGKRTEACFTADCVTGPYTGGDVLCTDIGFFDQGVAQGGIVQGPDGVWHGLLFQDHGAVGRVPVLCDVKWENDFPVFSVSDLPPQNNSEIAALYTSGESFAGPLSPMWQTNHQPDRKTYAAGENDLTLFLQQAEDMEHAKGTLTQRAFGPKSTVTVCLDASGLQEGGRAGIGVLQGCFAGIFAEKRDGGYYLGREARIARQKSLKSTEPITVTEYFPLSAPGILLRMEMDFADLADTVSFSAEIGGEWMPLGEPHRLQYRLDHFMGARIALYGYDTRESGSTAVFTDYRCEIFH